MSFELSLTATLEIAEYAIRVLGTNVLSELVLCPEANLPRNISVITRFRCGTFITPKSQGAMDPIFVLSQCSA
jgi:hypothetical protein